MTGALGQKTGIWEESWGRGDEGEGDKESLPEKGTFQLGLVGTAAGVCRQWGTGRERVYCVQTLLCILILLCTDTVVCS